jgi:hypothetical protein
LNWTSPSLLNLKISWKVAGMGFFFHLLFFSWGQGGGGGWGNDFLNLFSSQTTLCCYCADGPSVNLVYI